MKKITAIITITALAVCNVAPVFAHGVKRVRRELTEQGYNHLEFQRTKPPFKLDACLDKERYHLHVDFYGKITEKTVIGSCEGKQSTENTSTAYAEDNTNKTLDAKSNQERSDTSNADNGEDVISDEAAFRALRRWGVNLRDLADK